MSWAMPLLLQWGRDLSVAEIQYVPASTQGFIMLQWGRDLSVAEIRSESMHVDALVKLQWGRDLSVAEMWQASGSPDVTIFSLQWGRDLSVAEIQRDRRPRLRHVHASMGPRPFGRGDLLLVLGGAEGGTASMGPRPFGRGDEGNDATAGAAPT